MTTTLCHRKHNASLDKGVCCGKAALQHDCTSATKQTLGIPPSCDVHLSVACDNKSQLEKAVKIDSLLSRCHSLVCCSGLPHTNSSGVPIQRISLDFCPSLTRREVEATRYHILIFPLQSANLTLHAAPGSRENRFRPFISPHIRIDALPYRYLLISPAKTLITSTLWRYSKGRRKIMMPVVSLRHGGFFTAARLSRAR